MPLQFDFGFAKKLIKVLNEGCTNFKMDGFDILNTWCAPVNN